MGTSNNKLLSVAETIQLIEQGKVLVLSGEEALLAQLPKGNWIGGTIPYFFLKDGAGRLDKENIYVSDFTDSVTEFQVKTYSKENLHTVCQGGYENGFHFMILPALVDIHASFALNSKDYKDLYKNPLIGLIAGIDLDELGTGKASKTFNGSTGEHYTNDAVVLHAKLKDSQVARLEIINVFEASNEIKLEVEQDGFRVKDCKINGETVNLYRYIKEQEIDISYPLVCDYSGATINTSFQSLDDEKEEVLFYAPLFKGKVYTTSNTFESYVATFGKKSKEVLSRETNLIYNCNCILNYVYGQLDKKSIGFSGATTFGEIAYQLLNQTFTYLAIDEHNA